MVKKNKGIFNVNKKSIYYDLKEFYERNQGVLYSYQDFETAGIKEFKVVTNKVRPFEEYEKNRLSNELIKILVHDICNEDCFQNVIGFITLNPVINYYDNFIKLFKANINEHKDKFPQIKELLNKLVKESGNSEEIKLGIILAAICNLEDIENVLKIFSVHNDYIFYVIKAHEYMENYNTIFELAKISKGYGKLFCVMNVRPTTYEIKKWMIEYGSENNLAVTELLSYTMLSLNLLEYFENTKFQEKELEAVAKSFSMLLSDYGIDELNDQIKVCNKFLEIINDVGNGIYSLYSVISILYSIEAFIIEEYKNKKKSTQYKLNEDYKQIIAACKNICEKNLWHEIIAKEISNIDIESSVLISCAEKTKYKLRKKEFELILSRDYTNALLYKYAFSVGSKSIKRSAIGLGLAKLPMKKILSGQDELKIENLDYEDIAHICFFIIIKYSQCEDFNNKYKDINIQALKSQLVETRIQAATNLQKFRDEFDSYDKEFIADAISTEMDVNVRKLLNALLINSSNKEKKYIEVNDNMHMDVHVKDIYLITVTVAGTIHIDLSELYNKLLEQDMVYLKREYGNEQDKCAIQVITNEGYLIGYVPHDNNFILKNLMAKGKYLYGKVKEISEDYSNIQIEIYLSYKDIIEEITGTLSLLSGEKEYYLQ